MLFPVHRAAPAYCYRCPLGLERATCHIDCLSDLERILREQQGRIAAVIAEPMLQGAGGMIVWPAEFLAGVRRLCDQYGVLMIADEVLTGFGRTGRMFACEHASDFSDIICLSKALTGGYLPLGATVTTDAVYDAFLSEDRTRTFFHGHSFTANPLACAVAIASLDLFQDTRALERVRDLEGWLRKGLAPLSALPVVGDVRVIGGVGIVELVTDWRVDGAAISTTSARAWRRRFSIGACCSGRSATCCISCRRTSSRNRKPPGRSSRSARCSPRRCDNQRMQPRRAVRLARALWIAWAIVVWNVVFDHAIVVAGRQYLEAARSAASGPGPYARMDDWMRPAVARGFWMATASGLAILCVGLVLIGFAVARLPPSHRR